jgi:diguanylate cyclase (GGDEF)-like protein
MIGLTTFNKLRLFPMPFVPYDASPHDIAKELVENNASTIPIETNNGDFTTASALQCLKIILTNDQKNQHLHKDNIITVSHTDNILTHLTCSNIRMGTLFVVTDEKAPIGYTNTTEIISQLFSNENCYTERLLSPEKHEIVNNSDSIYTVHKTLFTAHSRLAIVVNENGHPEGIITDKLVSSLIERGCDIWNTKASEVALGTLIIPNEDCLHLFLSTFLLKSIDIAVVVDDEGKPAGTISREDFLTGRCECPIRQSTALTHSPDSHQEGNTSSATFLEKVLTHTFKTGIIGTDEHLGIIYFNSAAGEFLDKPEILRLGNPIWIISDACNISRHEMLEALKNAKTGAEQVINSWLNINEEKHFVQYRISMVPSNDGLAGYVISIQDTTSQRHAEANIRKLAYYDKLTQLPNRLLFEERIQQEIKRCKRTNAQFTFMIMDLDGFKQINDTLGHHIGDLLLRAVGNRLERTVRASDTVARFGGDEFIFLLPDIGTAAAAQTFIIKIREITGEPYIIDEQKTSINGSLGYAIYPDDGDSYEDLLKKADARMYHNKRAC